MALLLIFDNLKDIQFEEHTLIGEPFDPLHWQEFGLRFEEWQAAARRYHVLD